MRSSLALALLTSPVLAQGALPDRILTASDAVPGDFFGSSLAVDEPWVVVGAPYDSDLGTQAGAVYVFERQPDGSLLEVQQLYSSDALAGFGQGQQFGASVAVRGDRIAVGAPNAFGIFFQTGAGFVFERVGGTFVEQGRLVPPTPGPWYAQEYFGASIAMDDSQVFLCGPQALGNLPGSGRVDVFDLNSTQFGSVRSVYPAEYGIFGAGRSLAVDGDRMLVGAPTGIGGYGSLPDSPLGGCAVLFERDAAGGWIEVDRLASSTPSDGEFVGIGVDLEGDRAVVTSYGPFDQSTGTQVGELRVFERDPLGAWSEVALLQAPSDPAGFYRGFGAVQLAGDRIHAIAATGIESWIVVYERSSAGTWAELEELRNPLALHNLSLAVADGKLYAGSANFQSGGAVYEYTDGALFHGEPTLSLAAGGQQELRVRSTEFANGVALLLGSRSGTSPGVVHGPSGLLMPLNFDGYTTTALSGGPVSPIVVALDADGKGDATVSVPAGATPTLAGTVLHHAALFLGGAPGAITLDAVSNAVALELVP